MHSVHCRRMRVRAREALANVSSAFGVRWPLCVCAARRDRTIYALPGALGGAPQKKKTTIKNALTIVSECDCLGVHRVAHLRAMSQHVTYFAYHTLSGLVRPTIPT